MVNRLGRAEDEWSNRIEKVVLLVEGSICGHKYIRKNTKLTKKAICSGSHPCASKFLQSDFIFRDL